MQNIKALILCQRTPSEGSQTCSYALFFSATLIYKCKVPAQLLPVAVIFINRPYAHKKWKGEKKNVM